MSPTQDNDHDVSSSPKEKLAQIQAESHITKTFVSLFRVKLNDIQERALKDSQYGNTFKLHDYERRVILRLNNSGIREGVVAGLLTLFATRRLRYVWMKRALERMPRQTTTTTTTTASSSASHHAPASPFSASESPMQKMILQRQQQWQQHQKVKVPPEGWFSWALGWAADLIISAMATVTVGIVMMDLDKIIPDVINIPLQPGESTVSREFCPTAVEWYQHLQRQAKLGNNELMKRILRHPMDKGTQGCLNFARNCQLRLQYEAKLRKEKGVSDPLFPVSIPPPGVPVPDDDDEDHDGLNLSLSSSSAAWADDHISGSGSEPSFYKDGDGNDNTTVGIGDVQGSNQWADDLAQDHENESRRP